MFAAVLLTMTSIDCNSIMCRPDPHHQDDIVCDPTLMEQSPHGKPQSNDINPYKLIATSSDYQSESSITGKLLLLYNFQNYYFS